MSVEQFESQVVSPKVEAFTNLAQELFQSDSPRLNFDVKNSSLNSIIKDFGSLEIVSANPSDKSTVGSCEWQAEQGLPCQDPPKEADKDKESESKADLKNTSADSSTPFDGTAGPTMPESDYNLAKTAGEKTEVGSCEWQAEQGLPCQDPPKEEAKDKESESKADLKNTSADSSTPFDGTAGPTMPESDHNFAKTAGAKTEVGSCEWQAEQGLPCQDPPEKKSEE